MPKRSYSAAGTYRYGFNGKENDNDVKGLGNQQDYGMRIYDARVGRFLTVDKLQSSFPDLTPYQFSGNTPIQAIDLDGLEPKGFMDYWAARTDPYMTKWGYTVQDFYDYETKKVWTVMSYPNLNEYYYWETTYENAQSLFQPLNTGLNKNNFGEWTGLFKEFKPKLLSEDKSFDILMTGVLAVPFVAVYGKAIALYLISEIIEEAAGVPIPDGPVDIYKYYLKRKAQKELLEKTVKKGIKELPGEGPGGMRRLEYEKADYHGKKDTKYKNKAPSNGQDALDNSIQVKETSPRRIGIDYESQEFVVFDRTSSNVYHGHVRKWEELHTDMKNTLINAGLVDRKGNILTGTHHE